MSANAPELRDPAWSRRVGIALAAVVIAWPLLVASEFRPWVLVGSDSGHAAMRFVASFFPPAASTEFLRMLARETWITVAIATSGLTLAFALALPLTLVATSTMSISALGHNRMPAAPFAVRQAARWTSVLLRSIPELVFALLFVRVVGLGPTSGVLAIGLAYGGMLAKVFAEIIESTDRSTSHLLLANGASRLQAFLYGVLPQAASELVSYLVYRWECAIRASVIMGFVGAGGLGQRMDESMKMFNGGETATMLIVFVLLVFIADLVSAFLRRRLA
ncbi:MAG: ABC transporter permease [Burkholderiaceae bacterium]|nr:ABC transporter permease [Burkholderiaceae bacterium]